MADPALEDVPFISHAAVMPVAVLRQTRSALPSPLKSDTCVTLQLAVGEDPVASCHRRAVHEPDRGLPGSGVAPHEVALAVAVEVADVRHRPVADRSGSMALDAGAVPFMSQIAVCPVAVLRHTRSVLPSPLKSPTCVTGQVGIAQDHGARGDAQRRS